MMLFVLASCGGHSIVTTKPIDIVIPPELAKAFEVSEMPAAPTEPLALPEAEKPTRHPKKRKERNPKKKLELTSAKGPAGPEAIAGPGSTRFPIPNRRPLLDPLVVGEKIWMDVTWLNTKAGEFELEVLPHKIMNGRKVYDLKGTARTSDLFSLVYKAEDWVESFVDYEGWFPYKFVLHGDETKHIRNNMELFDHGARKQFVAVYDNRIQKNEIVEEKGFKDLTPLSQDALSAIYFVRTLKFEEGKVLKFPMTTNGSQWETEVTVLGREEVSTKMGFLRAFKTKVETRFKGVLQQQGDTFMWFSDDEFKYLLRFEAKVKIGWVAGITRLIEPGKASGDMPAPNPGMKFKEDSTSRGGGSATGRETAEASGKRHVWFHQLIESVASAVKKK